MGGVVESGVDAATIDLLGVLAYGELTAFERLASDARLAPSIGDKAALATMAAAEFAHFTLLRDHLVKLGVDPEEAMEPFMAPLDEFHDTTDPNDWLEGLIKAYVGDGLATDFYREVSAFVKDEDTRGLVLHVLADTGQAEFAVSRVREATAEDPAVAGRLALWARRLVGEALLQAQRVAVEREALTELLVGGSGDLAGIARLLTRLTDNHTARMQALGLQP
ncbi:MAG: tRNA 2-methylthio-N6-isopentenyl adenosine(37) hydroxylase MiaE-like protein [Frankiaceae bacterium]|nr:tRNA 2-methylthio-N6-isopentenyl adenosine(37) hydroxylase MiaE-like protein [Frankiaceae bacterium]